MLAEDGAAPVEVAAAAEAADVATDRRGRETCTGAGRGPISVDAGVGAVRWWDTACCGRLRPRDSSSSRKRATMLEPGWE